MFHHTGGQDANRLPRRELWRSKFVQEERSRLDDRVEVGEQLVMKNNRRTRVRRQRVPHDRQEPPETFLLLPKPFVRLQITTPESLPRGLGQRLRLRHVRRIDQVWRDVERNPMSESMAEPLEVVEPVLPIHEVLPELVRQGRPDLLIRLAE